jgi:hypothetical protein
MPLTRVNWTVNERISQVDQQAIGDLGFANLALGLKQFLAPELGVVKGGGYELAGGLSLTLKPLAAVASGGVCIVEGDYALAPFAPNASGQDRIDLVSIGYAEAASDAAQRLIINPVSGVETETNVNTRISSAPTITVTQGVPDTPPAAPATPAGHVPLYEVLVRNGAADLLDSDLTRVESSVVRPLKTVVSPNVGPPVVWPYTSNPLAGVVTPQGGVTLLIGSLTANLHFHNNDFFRLRIINADSLAVIATALYARALASVVSPELTMFVMAALIGPLAATNYALHLERDDGGSGSIALTTVSGIALAALTF